MQSEEHGGCFENVRQDAMSKCGHLKGYTWEDVPWKDQGK